MALNDVVYHFQANLIVTTQSPQEAAISWLAAESSEDLSYRSATPWTPDRGLRLDLLTPSHLGDKVRDVIRGSYLTDSIIGSSLLTGPELTTRCCLVRQRCLKL